MRKILSILIASFYLLISAGIIIHVHQCGDEDKSVEFYSNQYSCCCGDVEDEGCCDNQVIIIQLDTEQTITTNYIATSAPFIFVSVLNATQITPLARFTLTFNKQRLQPFSLHKQPIYIANCSLTYYG